MPGSSPRGRGKLGPEVAEGRRGGLIPAWAGKTCPLARVPQRGEAHPRVGGENARFIRRDHLRSGSSPRGRGKLGPFVCIW